MAELTVERRVTGPEIRVLRYGTGRAGLGQMSLYDSDDDWSRFEIARDEFERVGTSDRENHSR